MKRYEVIFTAVMVTIIVHLLVAIVFMVLKISALKSKTVSEMYVTMEEEQEEVKPPEEKETKGTGDEEVFQKAAFDKAVNMAKNIADKPANIDPAEYQDMIKNEMIRNGELGKSNFIDEQKNAEAAENDEIPINNNEKKTIEVKQKEVEKNVTFKGPTRIFYDLTGRHHVYLPIPIYKCEGAGQITLSIEVDQNGTVKNATPVSQLSSTSDECLTETAETFALRARFNSDKSAPTIQKGFLTFVFVSQKK